MSSSVALVRVLPAVATKSDLDALGSRLEGQIHASEARMFRWMLGFFATLWVGNVALIVTVVLKF